MSDFAAEFSKVTDMISGAAKGIFNKVDHMLFNALIGCLKSNDYEAAKVAIDQMVKENKPVSIPPLYFVSREHPVLRIREEAARGLKAFKQDKRIEELTAGKEIKEAVRALVEEFGNYRE
ncbi:MAG: hypothetical protein JST01_04755 [Cyanobacteria bacterium SZAS TMP-1]|nr:hypothetical protein [Cyanobacteria bacterium SZAS TMP-1]